MRTSSPLSASRSNARSIAAAIHSRLIPESAPSDQGQVQRCSRVAAGVLDCGEQGGLIPGLED